MSERRRYHPTDFGNAQWKRILRFALERADGFSCAIPYPYVVQDLWEAPLVFRVLEGIRPALAERELSMIRWERTQEQANQFLHFRMTGEVRDFVRKPKGLEAWSWRQNMPEDPSFHLGATTLVTTESGSGRIAVYANPEEHAWLTDQGVRLIEPLGVRAKPWPTP